MNVVADIVFGVFGLVFGSFLNVAIYRFPRRLSVVSPPSACPRCGAPIKPRDNIPVLSYVLLAGRCRACGAPISVEYPLVEAATAALFVLAAVRFSGSVVVAAMVAAFLGVMLAAALIDVRHRIIPNRLVYPSAVVFAMTIVVARLAGVGVSPVRGALGLLVFGGGLLLVALVSPAGMGIGDVKLAGLIGLVLGSLAWRYMVVAAATGVLLGGLGAVIALLLGKSRKETIPFGPFLAAGAIIAALAAGPIASWYGGRLG